MQNLINDLSILTSIDKKVFEKLSQNIIFCMCDYLETAALNNDDVCQIDIGIGILSINIDNDKVTYKFIPSHQFEENIINTLENQQNSLVSTIDSTLINKLSKLYDNFL